MSYRMMVNVDGKWAGNSCRFETKDEAERAGVELLSRWFVPLGSRAEESTDPVNYRFPVDSPRPESIK